MPPGKQLTTKNSGELEEGDHHSPEKVFGLPEEMVAADARVIQARLFYI